MKINLFNTRSRRIEEFKPVSAGKISLYSCGPTVYDRAHIGNLRAYIFVDLLVRFLKSQGYSVQWVMNITDIDDKTLIAARSHHQKLKDYTKSYKDQFFADLKKLNVLTADHYPQATDYFFKMWQLVEILINKGIAYPAPDGSIYFAIDKFPDYGKFAGLDRGGLKAGARVSQDTYDKENPADFVLWKKDPAFSAANEGIAIPEKSAVADDSRPGWHLECSVMSVELLGQPIDIHTGGIDLIFPHHQNEIAQSESATGKPLANFWLHNEHLLVDGRKMAKSLGNFYTLDEVEKRGFEPLALRYMFLSAHYRSKLNFTWAEMAAAQTTLNSLRTFVSECDEKGSGSDQIDQAKQRFYAALSDDLNSPKALKELHEIMKKANRAGLKNQGVKAVILELDRVLGLQLDQAVTIPDEVKKLVNDREVARRAGDFAKSDQIRIKINNLGYQIKDTKQGPQIGK